MTPREQWAFAWRLVRVLWEHTDQCDLLADSWDDIHGLNGAQRHVPYYPEAVEIFWNREVPGPPEDLVQDWRIARDVFGDVPRTTGGRAVLS